MNIVCKLALIAILWTSTVNGDVTYHVAVYEPVPHQTCMQLVNEKREKKGLVKWVNDKELRIELAQMFKDKCPTEERIWMKDHNRKDMKFEYEVGKLDSFLTKSLVDPLKKNFVCIELECNPGSEVTYYFVTTGSTQITVTPSPKFGEARAEYGGLSSGDPKSMESSALSSSSLLLLLTGFLAVVQSF